MGLTCKYPDRHNPKLMCGHPLPCPHHTAILHLDKEPPTIEIPATATEALEKRAILAEIAGVLNPEKSP